MRLFAQKGTSPIKHSAPVSGGSYSTNSTSRSSGVVVGVSLARLAHAHDAGLGRPRTGAASARGGSLCTLAEPVADETGPLVAALLPIAASEAPPETNAPEADEAFIACGESGARLSVQDIQCGAVDLSSRDLHCILPQIALFATNVTSLNLARNALKSLPDEIGYLVCLQRIDVSQNCLESLPDTLAFCQTLHTIDASQNRLVGLPSSMQHCRLLREVVLADNMLESVPACLWNLGFLTSLSLANNRIRVLPARMFMPGGIAATNRPPALHLDLYGCPIGQGLTEHVPSPPLVLSARFKYGVIATDVSQQCPSSDSRASTASRRILSLADTIICKMANSNAGYPYELPDHLQERLDSLVVCDHCHTLYPAGTGVKRWRLIHRQESVWPVEYSFCQAHWNDEKQRIASLFAPRMLESAQPYSEPKRAVLSWAQLKIAQTCQSLHRASAPSLASLASRLSLSSQVSNSSWLKRVSSAHQRPKHGAPQEPPKGVDGSVSRTTSFLGLRLPCFVASTASSGALDLEPATVWQYYEGYVPRLPAMQQR
ncbi:hypothetical protein GGF42_007850 [Coemansia sp. RSA 2424]|nr:hypothetical protein GGF42_007850 [Coemansia sp. RSA 2424]